MPDWAELTAIPCGMRKPPRGLTAPLVAMRYEEKYGRVQLIETIRDALHADRARPGQAHRAFARLPFDTVYTTNFDLLLEHAYLDEGRPSRSLAGEQQLPFHAGQTAARSVKMHGDLRHEEHIVITQSDYDSFFTRYPVVATHLSAMLITRTPLFIGYSLSDPDFNSIRRVVRDRLGPFERMAYVVQFDVADQAIEDGFKEKLHIDPSLGVDIRAVTRHSGRSSWKFWSIWTRNPLAIFALHVLMCSKIRSKIFLRPSNLPMRLLLSKPRLASAS